MATKKKSDRFVLVTTEFRGVFAGYLEEENGATLTLTQARNAILWGTKRGFLELADTGPTSASRIGAPAPRLKLHKVTSVTDCTPAAIEAWESAK